MIKNKLSIYFLVFMALIISACAIKTAPPEERAVLRWTAIINNDWGKAYEFQTPNYRKTYNSESYRNSYGGALKWIGVKLLSVDYPEENIADVSLEITTTISEAGNLPIPAVVKERWQLIDGKWWHVKK